MNKNVILAIVAVIIVVGAGALLLSKKTTAPVMTTPQQTATKPTTVPSLTMEPSTSEAASSPSAAAGKKVTKEFTVTASNFKFDTSKITVKKGDVVTINFMNSEGFHDFVIDAFNVKTNVIPAGQAETVQFTADKTGSFPFYCSVANHRQMGMQGTLVVE